MAGERLGRIACNSKYINQAAKPHQLYDETCVIDGYNIVRVTTFAVPGPLKEIDILAGFAQKGLRAPFNVVVPRPWRIQLWKLLSGETFVTGEDDPDRMQADDMEVESHSNGVRKPVLTIHFTKEKGNWRLVRILKSRS